MQIVHDFPPIIDRIREVFPLDGNEIFAWGETIYNPTGNKLPVWLIEHEKVHSRQHSDVGGPEKWWDRYLVDPEWRYQQELEAHQREYRSFCAYNKDRNKRVKYLQMIARRLASPMYGSVVKPGEAMRRIRNG